ncbi:MAG: type IVB secretion system protein IcmH/DotU [Pseudomonadota bacterium]|nr:type IVB secretion system protein IcmH/DotU [Pseudomonadota bacterium]
MSQDDPFFNPDDSDRTVIRPMPGGRRVGGPPPGGAPPPPPREPGDEAPRWIGELTAGSAANPLVRCAAPLLAVAGQLRNTLSHPDPAGLRNHLVREVRGFETCVRADGIADSVVLPARYMLCSLLDEAVMGTPWGSESIWSNQGLLISFHNETWGGEKFFQALERLIAYPSGNLHMLELMYLCLALGFEGRYRVREGGRDQLEAVRERLFQTIRAQRGDPEPELSPHWRGVVERRDPLIHTVPLWVLSAVAGVLLLALFTGFTFALNQDSDPVYLDLANLDKGLPTVEAPRTPVAVAEPVPEPVKPVYEEPPLTLRILLAEEIRADLLEVVDRQEGQTVVMHGDGLFRSGRAAVNDKYRPLLARIGESLSQLPGRVLVTGHTDSVPIRTLRFPSNYDLSLARAETVSKLLAEVTDDPGRFTAEGRADTELRVPENPKDARNRRVEITLRPASAAGRIRE